MLNFWGKMSEGGDGAEAKQHIRGLMSELTGGPPRSAALIHPLNKHEVAQAKQIIQYRGGR